MAADSSSSPVLAWTAGIALAVAVVRARTQSMTIDEADAFLMWVARPGPAHWEAASNNHILNSLLTRFTTSAFGVSEFTVRLPALLGAVILIAAAYTLCRTLTRSAYVAWPLFVCLVYNPFVMDYLPAARGYSLALGFLVAALALAARLQIEGVSRSLQPAAVCAGISACAALSFAANFSFGFVAGMTWLVLSGWIWKTHGGRPLRNVAACTLPGLVVSLLLTVWTVAHWSNRQIWIGTKSLGDVFAGILEASLYRLNPHLANPLVLKLLGGIQPYVLPALGATALAAATVIFVERGRRRAEGERSLAAFWAAVAAITSLTVVLHWIAFRLFLPFMPYGRTALFLAPLLTLVAGVPAAMPAVSRAGAWCRRGVIVMLFATAVCFLFSMRLSHFKEWRWNADGNRIYWILAYYNRHYGVRDVGVHWKCAAVLNYYRYQSGQEDFTEFAPSNRTYPPGRQIYVVDFPFEQDFVRNNGLKVVYLGELSEMAIAIRPELERK